MNERNKELLEKLRRAINARDLILSFSVRSSILNKLKNLFFAPDLYISYILSKIGINKMKLKNMELFYGKTLLLEISNKDFFYVFKMPLYKETNLTKFFIKNLTSDDVFYDIGANYGFYTYLALEFCKEVHSFEPIDYIIESIRMNTLQEVNAKKLFLHSVAISNKIGDAEFYLYKNHIGSSSLLINTESKDKVVLKVPTITLDEYIKTHNKSTIIKIDVEGAEKLVIEGWLNFFKNNSPIITLEVWSKDDKGEISMEAVSLLRNLGYSSYYIDIEGEIHYIDGDLSEFVKRNKRGLDNFVFMKK